MKEAMLYEKVENLYVKCNLCNHRCKIAPKKRGICGVRENIDGTLYTLVYPKAISSNLDPIEKKPIFHLFPGSYSYSIATVGCNFRCKHCQNAEISQMVFDHKKIIGSDYPPENVVRDALDTNSKSIAYTYTEPTIFFEYAYDTSVIAHEKGIKNVFVTNGYMTKEAIDAISPYLDAANVDLKAFTEKFYKDICAAKLEPVLESIRYMKKKGIWVEVTTLIIPGLNDSEEELKQIADFIFSVGEEVPWHVSAFYPTYRLTDRSRTPASTLKKAREIGIQRGLRYVYTGNIPGDEGENTYCYNCKKLLIKRFGFQITKKDIKDGKCIYCGAQIDGIGM
ncbi:MAG: AmmeMemoRadiSam system radical SAM enzyme [Deltaproteobacteria bacterium]|nr:AmmeMemoRadiSam system radical SAM enzyme [Deltaproteobacteria bacterium]